ncbi:MAG: NUDIX hydrolase [Candidatus Altiarchaeota archaeon]
MIDVKTPSVTVDAAIVEAGKIVFIRRVNPPFKGSWALPGGFVDLGEKVEDACVREAKEETSLDVKIKKLVGVYSDPKRDPRGHTVGIIFLCDIVGGKLKAADDAKEAKWFSLDALPELAFDHGKIVADVKAMLQI